MSTESGAASTPDLTTDDTEHFRKEMIQVAAVAVAIVEDLDYGMADSSNIPPHARISQTGYVLSEVDDERWRQDQKWGPQHHDPQDWMLILMEEVGEAAEATRPWRYPISRSIFRADMVKEITVLGNKIKDKLDQLGGVPR